VVHRPFDAICLDLGRSLFEDRQPGRGLSRVQALRELAADPDIVAQADLDYLIANLGRVRPVLAHCVVHEDYKGLDG
jgi:hypothetical protein